MKNKLDLFKYLNDLKINFHTYDHEPVYTVEQAKKICDFIPGCHCKNLFLKDKENKFWLVVAKNTTKIDLKKLAKHFKAGSFRFAKEEDLKNCLGVTIGSVTPLGLINDNKNEVSVIIEKNLFDCKLLNFHPLTNDATTSISNEDFKKFLNSLGNRIEEIIFD